MLSFFDGKQPVFPPLPNGITSVYGQSCAYVHRFVPFPSIFEEATSLLYYFAPLEGITNQLYRRVHRALFPALDKYMTPFFVLGSQKGLSNKDLRMLEAERQSGVPLVPQLLTNRSEDFLLAEQQLQKLGFTEVNLNLGCPSGTVFSKKRGAGFLAHPDALCRFLEEVFSSVLLPVSVKTRIGVSDPQEWDCLLSLYNRYPLSELIIHPRVREDYYHGKPNLAAFSQALRESRAPVVYSGDLFTKAEMERFTTTYPKTKAVMLGRGLIANPALSASVLQGTPLTKEQLMTFHQELYTAYQESLSGTQPLLHKMKELWHYMISLFPGHEKHGKRLRKAQSMAEYEAAVTAIFRDLPFQPDLGFLPPHMR